MSGHQSNPGMMCAPGCADVDGHVPECPTARREEAIKRSLRPPAAGQPTEVTVIVATVSERLAAYDRHFESLGMPPGEPDPLAWLAARVAEIPPVEPRRICGWCAWEGPPGPGSPPDMQAHLEAYERHPMRAIAGAADAVARLWADLTSQEMYGEWLRAGMEGTDDFERFEDAMQAMRDACRGVSPSPATAQCRICQRPTDLPPGTGHCASLHGTCGICGCPRATCKCLVAELMGAPSPATADGVESLRTDARELLTDMLAEASPAYRDTGSVTISRGTLERLEEVLSRLLASAPGGGK